MRKPRNIGSAINLVNDSRGMDLSFSAREVEIILTWKAKPFWPDEDRVLMKLRRIAGGEPLVLGRMQLQILYGWAEEQLGGHYGGGKVVNPEELAILQKLEAALER